MLSPSQNWLWFVDSKTGYLSISLDNDLIFNTPYQGSQLHTQPNAFCLEDLAVYQEVEDSLMYLGLKGAAMTQAALNICAARYHKHRGHKSWLYQEAVNPTNNKLCVLATQSDSAFAYVIERDSQHSHIMLLTPLALDNGKTLHQFSLLNSLNNRLGTYSQVTTVKIRA